MRAEDVRTAYRALVRPWLLPDGRADWLPWALAKGFALTRRHAYDVLISYAFPHTCHFVGWALRGRPPVPWVIHQGDLWSFSPGIGLPRWRQAVDRHLEAAVLRRASRIIVNTEATVDGYERHFPEIPRSRFTVIPTGYDARLYEEVEPERSERFRLAYTGAVSDGTRSHFTLLEALAEVKRRGIVDLECVMAGNLPHSLPERGERLGLGRLVDFRGFQPARVTAELQKGVDVLVLFGMPQGLQVPSKLYEYYAARRPLLVIRGDSADVAAADVARTRRGLVVDDQVDAVADAIALLHDLWKQGALESSFDLKGVPALTWEEAGSRFLSVVAAAQGLKT